MSERALRGVSAAPGVACGKAVVLDRAGAHEAKTIRPADRPPELDRARHALEVVADEMEQIALRLRDAGRHPEADIIETGALMAGDPGLAARVETLVMKSGRPAADALREAAEESAMELAQLGDAFLAERADDVRSLGRRAAARASGLMPGTVSGVLVASTLGPADVAELAINAEGMALAGGGVTAHAAIVARSLGVPMVVGLGPEVLPAPGAWPNRRRPRRGEAKAHRARACGRQSPAACADERRSSPPHPRQRGEHRRGAGGAAAGG